MADLRKMAEYVVRKEGGWAPTLDGGTNYGISKRFNPDVDVQNLSREQAIEIWIERYLSKWDQKMRFGEWPQAIANKITDLLAPDNDIPKAAKVLQRALNLTPLPRPIEVDGIVGPATLGALRWASLAPGALAVLLAVLRSEIAGEYRLEAARHPHLAKYERGWVGRAYS